MSSTPHGHYQDWVFSYAVFEAEHNGEDWAINDLADMIVDASPEDRIRLIRAWASSARACRDGLNRQVTEEAKTYVARRVLRYWDPKSRLPSDLYQGLIENAIGFIQEDRWYAIRFGGRQVEPTLDKPRDQVVSLKLTVDPIV